MAESSAPSLQFVLAGALWTLEEAARTTVVLLTTLGEPVARRAPEPVKRLVGDVVRELDRRGHAVVEAGRQEALHLVDDIVVEDVLPTVLDHLATEPEQVQAIVQGQSRRMVDDVVRTTRDRAVDADEVVDRLVTRLLRRRRLPQRAPFGHDATVAAVWAGIAPTS